MNRELANLRQRNSTKVQSLRRELAGVRRRVRKHYEAIESGTLELELVADRLRELRDWKGELQQQLERYRRPKQLPPYLMKDENLARIQADLTETFFSNEREITKRYLNFLLERIDINGDAVNLVGNSAALCNFALARKTEGVVNHPVPTVDLSWLPRPPPCRRPGYRQDVQGRCLLSRLAEEEATGAPTWKPTLPPDVATLTCSETVPSIVP